MINSINSKSREDKNERSNNSDKEGEMDIVISRKYCKSFQTFSNERSSHNENQTREGKNEKTDKSKKLEVIILKYVKSYFSFLFSFPPDFIKHLRLFLTVLFD